jgi:hypothetical protein
MLREPPTSHNGRPEDKDVGLDVHVAERYLTKPAIVRHMPEHSREPRTAFEILEAEVLLDGDPSKNLAIATTSTTPSTRAPRRSPSAASGCCTACSTARASPTRQAPRAPGRRRP